jgi:tetratricopeptide (TPR) repeat protein
LSEQIKKLDSKNVAARVLLVGAILLALVFGWFSIRWQLGNMLAELTSTGDANAKEVADVAVRFAPNDPLTNWFRASIEKDLFTTEKIENSVKLYENVVRISPNDFRWWIELGRAREQSEKIPQAEEAFKKAVALAPAYTFPHWQLGNFYLRQNRRDEAFAELRQAAEKNALYREQVLATAWEFFDKDVAKVESLVSDSLDSKTTLIKFYVQKSRAEDALRIWNTISDEDKKLNLVTTKLIAQGLYERRFYRSAVEFARQLEIDPEAKIETVTNGGFEKLLAVPSETYFGWKANSSPVDKVEIKSDPTQKKEGSRSLRVLFSGYVRPDFYNLWQTVALQPKGKYRLSFWVKTEGLKSAGTPLIEVINANDDKMITSTKPFPIGTNEWQEIVLDFTAPENCEGINIRTNRFFCGDACPIFGTIWLDDFKLGSQ